MENQVHSILKIAKQVIAGGKWFQELAIGDTFYDKIGRGAGAESGTYAITFFKKIDKRNAKVVKADWAPRSVGSTNSFGPKTTVYPHDVPSHDTRKVGL